jgi:hypothetical protein
VLKLCYHVLISVDIRVGHVLIVLSNIIVLLLLLNLLLLL